MNTIKKNLEKYNIKIPAPISPIANYNPYIITKNLVFISGQIPISDGNILFQGKVEKEIDIESSKKAARLCMLNSFAVLKNALNNDLSLIEKCIKITVYVNSYDTFSKQPFVADGASDLIAEVLEPNGAHSRSAVGVSSLPKNSAVEIDSIFEVNFEK